MSRQNWTQWLARLLPGPRGRRARPAARNALRNVGRAIETLDHRVLLSAAAAVNTVPANAVSATGATLNGSVNPQGSTCAALFQYSTDATFPPSVQTTVGSGFNSPGAVAVDAAGDLFVADTDNSTVKEVLPNGVILTIGSGFNHPTSVAVDAAGDVFVADAYNSAVKEVLPNGRMLTVGSGFSFPYGVAVDAAGDVFVADDNNSAVKEVLRGGGIVTVGSGFDSPTDVAVDAAGDVFVTDAGDSPIKEILPNGDIQSVGSGFNNPIGLAVDAAGDVFVADLGNNAVKEVLPGGSMLTLGSGFNYPEGVAVDAAGDVFVADAGNDQVVALSPPKVAATPSPLTGSTATGVSGTVIGLTPGTTYYYRVVAFSAGGTIAAQTVEFATPPVMVVGGPAVTYNTGGPAIAVAPAARLSTGDAALANVSLSVVNTNGGQSDRLGIRASGSLTVSGTTLSYNHTAIGTFSGGAYKTPLVVAFNASATEAAIVAVAQNVTFWNTTLDPGMLSNRTVTFQVTDETGNHGAAVNQTVKFVTPPVLAIGGPAATYNTGGPAVAVAPAATLASGDGDFAKASLSVVNTNGGQSDRLGIRASGNLTVSGTTLSYSHIAIGTFTGGAYKTPLVVTFNASATKAAILTVAQNVTFWNTTLDPGLLSNRTVTFQLTDGARNHGAVVAQTVKFVTPPVLAIGGPTVTYSPGGPAIALAPAATLSSGDGAFAKTSLSIVDTTFASYPSDRLSVRSSGSLVVSGAALEYGGVAIGSFTGGGAGTLAISFNASATEAAILAVIRNVTFSNVNAAPTIADRSIKFQLTDGAGNLGEPVTQTVRFA